MNVFYKVSITKEQVGSAIQHKEPSLQGKIVIKVMDSTTRGDFKIFVMECDEAQNKANLSKPGIEKLTEEQAVKLAAKYQPKRTMVELNPRTMKEEKVTIPACDLRKFYKK
ncbi:MAG: hypothetical protein GTO45_41030 [Candidatus Aminicenantes bacterium]|nr:hypothetical protein [Candidatus Aminicenantes bacterium]NIM84989.1 hypothetical protein [Candidatus Aminicenantes bacterium]NIN24503.1 hypothetical protein [Candidatus Aminicenantes bacterium]NIN48267.1 hypothetical protein [Candidatus Aminicenantes bacterium]NIN91170.1 hypothetical protein [Candidatus Aminicenantes bacterium]